MNYPTLPVLLIDDDDTLREACRRLLEAEGMQVSATADPFQGLDWATQNFYPVALVDYRMPGMSGLELIEKLRAATPQTRIIMMTGYATIEMAVEAMKGGANDYIAKPFEPQTLLEIIQRLAGDHPATPTQEADYYSFPFNGQTITIVAKSSAMNQVLALVTKVAVTESTVLIQGESGTGKELIAKAIHAASLRQSKPFFTMDCGTLVESLFESELFGHIKGSFTGAHVTKHGAFELADGGTFFFDEIGNISMNVQAKILRAIQEKEIRRVGDTQNIKVDVRVIAATNLDLQQASSQGQFREDLYYRLSVFPIVLPPLRERREDIPLLVEHILQRQNLRRRKPSLLGVTTQTMDALLNYHWPGNIRELENVLERAAIIEETPMIGVASLPSQFKAEKREQNSNTMQTLDEMERFHIERILKNNDFNISKTAKALGIDRKTLALKIRKYNLPTHG
jgi:DNA-binding NtrC family response regulator